MITYGIPDLQFNDFIINFKTEWTELYSDCNLMFSFELIVHNSLHQATFSYSSISNNNKFKEMILCA